jgi:rare lipoprotein A
MRALGIIYLGALALSACAIPRSRVSFPTPPPAPAARATQTGIASWYGPGFHGKATSSGTIYDQNELTAAHQTLPLGTRALVTNLDTSRSLELTINDRGPFAKGRILDLSYASAQVLGAVGPGTIPVRIEVIDSPQPISTIRSSLDYTLQLGSFAQLQNAQSLRDRLAKSFADISIVPLAVNEMTYYRVQMGNFSERTAAEEKARAIAEAGYPVIIMEK